MKKILVPTDFSKSSENALEFACEIAQQSNGEIELYHIIEGVGHDSFSATGGSVGNLMDQVFMVELMKKVKSKILKLTEKYSERVTLKTKVEVGKVSQTLLKHIEESGTDLVIMGSRGLSNMDRFFIGSNADKLVKSSTVPVLIIHDENVSTNFRNIVFATNTEEEVGDVIEKVKGLQQLFGSTVHVLRVITQSDFYTNKEVQYELDSFIEKYPIDNYKLSFYNADSVEEGVLDYANEINADIVAMVSHKRSFFGNLFGSTSNDIASHSKLPVMIFNIKR